MTVGAVLDIYGREHGPHIADPARLVSSLNQLGPWWADQLVSSITANTCRRYLRDRQEQHAKREAERVARAAEAGKACKPARTLQPSTVRRELGTIRAALQYCVLEGYLVSAPPVWLPEKGEARQRHLERGEIARLIWEARKSHRAGLHLPLFILIAFYTGARRTAILQLQWQPNTVAGHVDLERGVIDFLGMRRQTKKRRTAIPVPPRLLRFLRYARRRTSQYVIEFEGKPIKDPKKALASAGDRAGLGNVFSHLLKHSGITYLVTQGVPLWHVAEWTGTSEETIRRVYGHMAPDHFAAVHAVFR